MQHSVVVLRSGIHAQCICSTPFIPQRKNSVSAMVSTCTHCMLLPPVKQALWGSLQSDVRMSYK